MREEIKLPLKYGEINMSQKLIKDFKIGDKVEGFFILRKKELRERKNKKEKYLALEIGDCSGRIQGSVWEKVEEVASILEVGNAVKVKAKVISYQNRPHLNVEKIRAAQKSDQIDLKSFLPKSEADIPALFAELVTALEVIETEPLRNLLDYFLNDDKFREKFLAAPGGKLWHHACIGGLVEHTLSVVSLCNRLAEHYGEQINRGLLLCAAFLHDIGKIDEFSTHGFIDYSTQGRLIGHVNIGFQRVSSAILKIENFPKKLSQQLLHCILSHHGAREKGAPVVPMTLEALILSYADELDSMVGAFRRIIEKENEPGKLWSNYVNLIDRFIYFGGIEEKD